jgi:hypothetical protein
MSVILASTWQPRGELPRLRQQLPRLQAAYSGIALALPPDVDADTALLLQDLLGSAPTIPTDWSHGRHAALQKALDSPGSHVHYADMDRLLHWVEAWPAEWESTLAAIPEHDCLIIGRSKRAWATHPRALQETERSINDIFSHLLGQPVDLGAGARGFSRPAALCLLANSPPGRALGTDAEWPVLLQRAGFAVDSLAVDGLEWESPDRQAGGPADEEPRRQAAAAYDQDVSHWLRRAALALEIIQAGLDASRREIEKKADYWRALE